MCKLTDKFDIKDISWKVVTCKWNNGKPWAMITPYLNASAIQQRLDDVFGWDNWKTEYKVEGTYAICYLSAFSQDKKEWIKKENVCEIDSEQNNPIKAAYSGSFKRVALEFGIGRYLKGIVQFAKSCCENPNSDERDNYIMCIENNKQTKEKKIFYALLPTQDEFKKIVEEIGAPTSDNPNTPKNEKKPTEIKKDNSPKLSKEAFKTVSDWINQKCKNPDILIADIKKCFGIPGLSDLTENQLQLLKDHSFIMKDVEKAYKAGDK
ncbi:hypothetical protein [Fusobacterium varium]